MIEPAYEELKEKADIYFEIDWSKKVNNDQDDIGVLKSGRVISGYRIRIINNKVKSISQSEEKQIDKFIESYLFRIGIHKKDTLARGAIRNWCIKYGAERVIEKLDGVSGYVKKSNKKLDYIQKVLTKEFDQIESNKKEIQKMINKIAKR